MIINKRYITAFSKTQPFVALATKSMIFDPTFSLKSELVLANYMTGKEYPPVTTDLKFCKILWCETPTASYLAAGHENGIISIYELKDEGLVLLKTKTYMEEDITALEYLPSKAVLVAGSCKGKIIFWTLTNLEKEYSLDIPLSVHITSIAWNPKTTKILCVGTNDGSIKVLDIKKNSVLMTLSSKDISEIKKIEWDSSNTILLVMSDREYLSTFDLSNDSVSRIGNHPQPLIGFHNDMIVSKNLIEHGQVKINIKDAFDCSISLKDPVIALSYFSGSTEILHVPKLAKKLPFFRKNNLVFTCGSTDSQSSNLSNLNDRLSVRQIVVENVGVDEKSDDFYSELRAMVQRSAKKEEIADFLIENAGSAQINTDGKIQVDLDDKTNLSIVKGDISSIKQSDKKIDISYLCAVLEQDSAVLREITDFQLLFVLSRIMNDYSALNEIQNPRILSAICLYNDISNFKKSDSSSGNEAMAILCHINKDINGYIDSKVGQGENYLANMSKIEKAINDLRDFIPDSLTLESKCVVDYFWYKVFKGEYDDVKMLNILDKNVEFYKRAASGLVAGLNSMHIESGTRRPPLHVSKVGEVQPMQSSFARKTAEIENAPGNPSFAQRPGMGGSAVSSLYGGARTGQGHPATASQVNMRGIPPSPGAVSESMQPQLAGHGMPGRGIPLPHANMPQPSISTPSRAPPIPQPGAAPGRIPGRIPPAGMPSPQINPMINQVPRVPMGNTQKPSQNIPAVGNRPEGIPQMSKMPPMGRMPSRVPVDTLSRQPSPNMAPRPAPPNTNPSFASPHSLNFVPRPDASSNTQQASLDGQSIVNQFDLLIATLREKAALKNSLIIRQRKNQCLQALESYGFVNKSTIPPSLLETMDLINRRVETVDSRLKPDIDMIISQQDDCVWLKAVAELIKMLY